MTWTLVETALFVSSSEPLALVAKATIILVLVLSVAWVAGRARASLRHVLLASSFGALAALPVVVGAAPDVTVELATPATSAAAETFPVASAPRASAPTSEGRVPPDAPTARRWQGLSWSGIVAVGWLAGVLVVLVPVVGDLCTLRRLRREGIPCPELADLVRAVASDSGIRRRIAVMRHEDVTTPLTYGGLCPVILLPREPGEEDAAGLRRVIVHETEHVRRNDWIVHLAARVVCAIYWFHPLVWVAWRRLCLEAERACDDAVVRNAACADYAEQLVALAKRMTGGRVRPALCMAIRGDLSIRVAALLDATQRRGRAGLLASGLVVLAATLVVIGVAPLRAAARVHEAPVAQDSPKAAAAAPTELDIALLEASERGDVARIARLLDAGANVNAAIDGDGGPLIAAARAGRLAAVRALVERGADPNLAVRGDGNPLIAAARAGHGDVVALLLDLGAKVDEAVPDDENALIQACGEGHLNVVRLLVSRGADVNARIWVESTYANPSGEWRSPLSMARKGRHETVVSFLLSTGAKE